MRLCLGGRCFLLCMGVGCMVHFRACMWFGGMNRLRTFVPVGGYSIPGIGGCCSYHLVLVE